MWTPRAVENGLNKWQNDENAILKLAVDGMIIGPNGTPYGSAGDCSHPNEFTCVCTEVGKEKGACRSTPLL